MLSSSDLIGAVASSSTATRGEEDTFFGPGCGCGGANADTDGAPRNDATRAALLNLMADVYDLVIATVSMLERGLSPAEAGKGGG